METKIQECEKKLEEQFFELLKNYLKAMAENNVPLNIAFLGLVNGTSSFLAFGLAKNANLAEMNSNELERFIFTLYKDLKELTFDFLEDEKMMMSKTLN